MDYKKRLKQYLEEDTIYSEYKSGKCDMSDFDKFCIEHCKDIECLLNENEEQKEVIDKANEWIKKKINSCTIEAESTTKDTMCKITISGLYNLLNILKEVE